MNAKVLPRPVGWVLVFALVLGWTQGCGAENRPAGASAPTNQTRHVRAPAVAGVFYPGDAAELSRSIDGYLAAATNRPIANLKALICPHAGYPYSGPVAAHAYKLLAGLDFQTVVLLGPSHYAQFQGGSVAAADAYATPLGTVEISPKAKSLARCPPYVLEAKCLVQRPGWWTQASKPAPEAGEDTPDTWEHSIEVQVPFLQKTLKNFTILPVVFGPTDPAAAARVLAEHLDDTTLIVASSDLSHYLPYAQAKEMDARTIRNICALETSRLGHDDACGLTPVLTLMHLARLKGWQAELLDARNSGDTAGDKSRVVGYAAIAFHGPAREAASEAAREPARLNASERKQLLGLARQALGEAVKTGRRPAVDAAQFSAELRRKQGCFVTLTQKGELRGCIGHIFPQEPLWQGILDNAQNAALRDPRFAPVTAGEVAGIQIEISVLSEPVPLEFKSPEDLLNKLQPHRDGVVLQVRGQGSTFLPQVWEQLPDKVEFLEHLSQKAGCPRGAWREAGTRVMIYHAEAFKEADGAAHRD